jgi:hypothetical protein
VAHKTQVPDPPHLESRFEAGKHVLRLSKVMEGRWSVAVDDAALSGSFRTQADAWEAGVREADRLDKLPAGGANAPPHT